MWDLEKIHENRVLSRWQKAFDRHPDQIGAFHESDAEMVRISEDEVLAVTVDTLAEEVRAGLYKNASTAGRISVLASLSDLAAVGAEPIGILISTTIPNENFNETQDNLAVGISEAIKASGVFVLGGDTNEGAALEVTTVAVGKVPASKVISRIGATRDDILYVSGPIGLGGALAAALLLEVTEFTEDDYHPTPRLTEGQKIRQYATCCMDTSDGLIATLDQLARLNDVGFELEIDFGAMLHPAAAKIRKQAELPAFPFAASYHGEFELVFTIRSDLEHTFLKAAQSIDWNPVRLGRVKDKPGIFSTGGEINGAWVRNLLQETNGNILEYAQRLIQEGPKD